jgi:predicted nucleotidyltransferase
MHFNEPFGGVIPGARGAVLAALMRTGRPLTGRQVHGLLRDDFSLWTVQQALKDLAGLGLVTTETVGRAGVHRINEEHVAIAPLRTLLSPLALLKAVLQDIVDDQVQTVVVFGSVGRGESGPDSDIDLAVIAKPGWDARARVEDTIRARLGRACDILAFTPAEFARLSTKGEPVVAAILTDGVALIGSLPRRKPGAASWPRPSNAATPRPS